MVSPLGDAEGTGSLLFLPAGYCPFYVDHLYQAVSALALLTFEAG